MLRASFTGIKFGARSAASVPFKKGSGFVKQTHQKKVISTMEESQACTMYIVRHGETDYNRQHRVQGHLQIPLNDTGRAQAKEAQVRFRSVHFDKVFASDLIRARETAEIIAQVHKLEVMLAQELREKYLSDYQGEHSSQPSGKIKNLLDKHYELTADERWNAAIVPGAEFNAQLVGRALTFLRGIAIGYPGKTILVVTHGGVVLTLAAHLGLIPKEDSYGYTVENAGFIQLQSDGTTFIMKQAEGLKKKS